MGERDHSITCERCGMQRGGINEYLCDCDIDAAPMRANGIDNGVCMTCDKPISFSEDGDDDEVCRRYKPYCRNRDNAVDWRARALTARQEAEALRAENESLRAKADVIGGDWCKQNRTDGRGPCGACAICCAELRAENERLRAEQDEARRHPMAPERCPVCEWTNIYLMNYGQPGSPRWMCHGCAARGIAERDTLRASLDCSGKGCGADESKACLRCCRIMLANYAANHGTRCDADQERLRASLEQVTGERDTAYERGRATGLDVGRRDAESRAIGERDEYHEMLRSILATCDAVAVRDILGPDAPLRAVRKALADRDRLAKEVEEREHERDTYRAMVCDLLSSAHPHPKEHPTMTRQWDRARELLKNGPPALATNGGDDV